MPSINQVELERFLSEDRHAILATNGPSGVPQLTPVWFLYENNHLYISAQADTVKVRNLRRDPAVSLCVDGGRGDPRYVVISGAASLVEPREPFQEEMRRRIICRYHASQEAADRYYQSVEDHAAVLIVVTPQKIVSQDLS
jgi:PPOX class probable F420-dependent enzyme